MAINPNTDFSAGAVLTASQQNRFPRGIMAVSLLTANGTLVNAETTRTNISFTAVANRYYKLTWFEPHLSNANLSTNNFYLRLDNATTGTILASANFTMAAGYTSPIMVECITTLSAGSRTIYARGDENAATATTLNAAATKPAFLLAEDLGPA